MRMPRLSCALTLCLGLALATNPFLLGCSSPGGDGGDPGPTDPGGGGGGPQDDPTLAELIAGIEQTLPTWDQIDAASTELARRPLAPFTIQIRDVDAPTADTGDPPMPTDGTTYFQGVWQHTQDLQEAWPEAHFWNAGVQLAPPYTQHDGSFFYPFDATLLDEKLRSMATVSAYQKSMGHLVHVTWFHPPWTFEVENRWQIHAENVDSPASYLEWWSDYHIPLWVQIAQMAERTHAEQIMPWDAEVGMLVRKAEADWFDAPMSPQEQLSFARELQDRLLAALRPVYSGTLAVPIYDRYAMVGDHWKQLDVSGWDRIIVVLYTEGDTEATEHYFDLQLPGYMQVVSNANVPWVAHIHTVREGHERLLPPGVAWEDIETDVWNASLDKVIAATPAPAGVNLCVAGIETEATRQAVHARLAQLGSH